MALLIYRPQGDTDEATVKRAPALFAYFARKGIAPEFRDWSGGTSLSDIPNSKPSILFTSLPQLDLRPLPLIAAMSQPQDHLLIMPTHGGPRQVLVNGRTRWLSIRNTVKNWLRKNGYTRKAS